MCLDYVVLNMSSNRPTSVRVFATTLKSQLDAFYPQLPKDPSLTFSLNQSNLSNALVSQILIKLHEPVKSM